MTHETREKSRFALLYAAAWIPYWLLYALGIFAQPTSDLTAAIAGSTCSTLTAALLGIGVWQFSSSIARRDWTRTRVLATHAVTALAYTAAWTGAVYAMVAIFAPPVALDSFSGGAMYFQALNGLAFYGVIAGVASWAAASRAERAERERATQGEVLRVNAELRALRAQLNPHFLFNTLHTISALARTDNTRVEGALLQLGDMLRYVLGAHDEHGDLVPFSDELRFVRAYIELEQMRLGDRLRVEWDVAPDALECEILPFTVQALVENAVRHGIAPRARGGVVRIRAIVANATLSITVADDGPGAALDASDGIGLRAVRQRLSARFGGRANLRVTTAVGAGFEAQVQVPVAA